MHKLFINGAFIASESPDVIDVLNPANGEVFAQVPRGNEKDVDKAVAAAKAAFPSWKHTTVAARIALMEKLKALLEKDLETLADLQQQEIAQPRQWIWEIHAERNINRIESFIEIAKNYDFEKALPSSTQYFEPWGVVACLTPWNYPIGQVVQKVVPALLAGNTVVLKPSQQAPVSSLYLAEKVAEAGFPAGVFNVVTGIGSEVGEALTKHPDVRMVSFTGSTAAGAKVGEMAIGKIKNIALELGGKSPAVVLDGADLTLAFDTVASSAFANSGQTCAAYTRLIVPESLKATAEKEMAQRAEIWLAREPNDPAAKLGPVVSKKQYEKVCDYIAKGRLQGATVIAGGAPEELPGWFVAPTVFSDVTPDMSIVTDEIFGPVLVIQTYPDGDVQAAIEVANNTTYGLAGAVFGPAEEALRVAKEIDAGQVLINAGSRDTYAPFGGYKASGLGREGGVLGFEEFLQSKVIFKS